ncbi:MAG: FecR domain-containing protein [Reyranella sp.]|nr:FecR domain-containing protein [Reyranella sp.]
MAFAAALAAEPAWARVGVTSVTDGDPLGQPPAEPERVLRVGIDVQANERITTRANDRAHVVFLDGTALTIGPNSALVIDRYVYDPNRKAGDIALNVTRGTFRFVGGAISKNNEVTIRTPSATIGIRGGIVTLSVSDSGATTANFLYGDSMRVTAQGSTQTATRSGSEITVPVGAPPTPPSLVPFGRMIGERPFEQNKVGLIQTAPTIQEQTTTSPPPSEPEPSGPSPTVQPVRTSIEEAFDRSSFDKSNSLLGPQLALTKGIRSDTIQGKPGQGGDKGASVSSLRLQKVANRAVTQQNIVFNNTATTNADRGNSAFGRAQGNSLGNNKGKGRGRGNNN